MESAERFELLAKKWLEGTITPEEIQEYNAWYNLLGDDQQQIDPKKAVSAEVLKTRMLNQIRQSAGLENDKNSLSGSQGKRNPENKNIKRTKKEPIDPGNSRRIFGKDSAIQKQISIKKEKYGSNTEFGFVENTPRKSDNLQEDTVQKEDPIDPQIDDMPINNLKEAEQFYGERPEVSEDPGCLQNSMKGYIVSLIKKPVWMVAATLILASLIGAFQYFHSNRNLDYAAYPTATIKSNEFKNDVLPGANKAILTLSNGKVITLNQQARGLLAIQGSTNILKTGDSGIVFENQPGYLSALMSQPLLINKMVTPKGGNYQLTLSDGSRVWLNAASSISFPAQFTGKERHVQIQGEAYFEVAKDSLRPFIISVDKMNISVLGTHFNVNAYKDASTVNTTLLEGSVKVTSRVATNGILLSKTIVPGEQSKLDSNGLIHVSKVDVEASVAWKSGFFQFNKASLKSLMKEIARWYNIDVQFQGTAPKDLFTGTIPKNLKLTELLSVLDYADVSFRLEKNHLIIFS